MAEGFKTSTKQYPESAMCDVQVRKVGRIDDAQECLPIFPEQPVNDAFQVSFELLEAAASVMSRYGQRKQSQKREAAMNGRSEKSGFGLLWQADSLPSRSHFTPVISDHNLAQLLFTRCAVHAEHAARCALCTQRRARRTRSAGNAVHAVTICTRNAGHAVHSAHHTPPTDEPSKKVSAFQSSQQTLCYHINCAMPLCIINQRGATCKVHRSVTINPANRPPDQEAPRFSELRTNTMQPHQLRNAARHYESAWRNVEVQRTIRPPNRPTGQTALRFSALETNTMPLHHFPNGARHHQSALTTGANSDKPDPQPEESSQQPTATGTQLRKATQRSEIAEAHIKDAYRVIAELQEDLAREAIRRAREIAAWEENVRDEKVKVERLQAREQMLSAEPSCGDQTVEVGCAGDYGEELERGGGEGEGDECDYEMSMNAHDTLQSRWAMQGIMGDALRGEEATGACCIVWYFGGTHFTPNARHKRREMHMNEHGHIAMEWSGDQYNKHWRMLQKMSFRPILASIPISLPCSECFGGAHFTLNAGHEKEHKLCPILAATPISLPFSILKIMLIRRRSRIVLHALVGVLSARMHGRCMIEGRDYDWSRLIREIGTVFFENFFISATRDSAHFPTLLDARLTSRLNGRARSSCPSSDLSIECSSSSYTSAEISPTSSSPVPSICIWNLASAVFVASPARVHSRTPLLTVLLAFVRDPMTPWKTHWRDASALPCTSLHIRTETDMSKLSQPDDVFEPIQAERDACVAGECGLLLASTKDALEHWHMTKNKAALVSPAGSDLDLIGALERINGNHISFCESVLASRTRGECGHVGRRGSWLELVGTVQAVDDAIGLEAEEDAEGLHLTSTMILASRKKKLVPLNAISISAHLQFETLRTFSNRLGLCLLCRLLQKGVEIRGIEEAYLLQVGRMNRTDTASSNAAIWLLSSLEMSQSDHHNMITLKSALLSDYASPSFVRRKAPSQIQCKEFIVSRRPVRLVPNQGLMSCAKMYKCSVPDIMNSRSWIYSRMEGDWSLKDKDIQRFKKRAKFLFGTKQNVYLRDFQGADILILKTVRRSKAIALIEGSADWLTSIYNIDAESRKLEVL
ncbi:uncharacterized protein MYCFIDRAFT_180703 [Pseudocercospora fijiensis CIRAD86]|uniref:Uncharacterized protein n=1 Tax=Pseudocercospora fijiensis (strain CIRAD86) TaxID=383855 RepID=M2YG72_PSEFD|nr:uncharacterized protein MYCFIDRAFT_180703 [Pseudocercospora fijiensis CIRAD86]EME76800.1 hypothetical protein MYCFIDRAFT_180703 [Pseudocercospora fijiensis CIRAD86]